MNYLEFKFVLTPIVPWRDILIAELGNVGFESFSDTENGVLAYINKDEYNKNDFDNISIFSNSLCKITYEKINVEPRNWNEEWEKNFNPIIVNNECIIRAPFHEKTNYKYEIIIEPKMSFGTGHHETTHLITQYILGIDMIGKTVMDMGCGTGILAILSAKKGAKKVDAVDIDEWSYKNTLENIKKNNVEFISVIHGDASFITKDSIYDLFIANINRNILINDFEKYAKSIKPKGILLISGFYECDVEQLTLEAKKNNFELIDKQIRNSWTALKFIKK